MAAPAVVTSNSAAGSGTTLSAPAPSGVTATDLVVILVVWADTAGATGNATITGFTQRGATQHYSPAGYNGHIAVFDSNGANMSGAGPWTVTYPTASLLNRAVTARLNGSARYHVGPSAFSAFASSANLAVASVTNTAHDTLELITMADDAAQTSSTPSGFTNIALGISDEYLWWATNAATGATATPTTSTGASGDRLGIAVSYVGLYDMGTAQSDGATTVTTADPIVSWALSGQSDGVGGNSSATLGLAQPLTAQADGATSVTTADLSLAIPLSGQVDGALTVSADLVLSLALAGQSDGSTTPSGDAIVAWALTGQEDGALSVTTADLTVTPAGGGPVAIDGQSDGATTTSADLTMTIALTGQSDGAGTASGDVGIALALSGQSGGVLTVTTANLTSGGFVYGSFGTHLGTPEFYGVLPGESWHDGAYRWWTGFPY